MSAFEEWKKGGLRYRRLKQRVQEFLSPSPVKGFCVVLREGGAGRRLFNSLLPFEREFVVAATDEGVYLLRLRRPGVFSSKILGKEYDEPLNAGAISWQEGKLVVNGDEYRPIAFHREDAERLARVGH